MKRKKILIETILYMLEIIKSVVKDLKNNEDEDNSWSWNDVLDSVECMIDAVESIRDRNTETEE